MSTTASNTGTTSTTPAKASGSVYQILKLVEFEEKDGAKIAGWMEVGGPISAPNAESLLKQAGSTGRYVAVPARSWKPVKVTVETQTVVKIADA